MMLKTHPHPHPLGPSADGRLCRLGQAVRSVTIRQHFQDVALELDRCVNAIPMVCLKPSEAIRMQVRWGARVQNRPSELAVLGTLRSGVLMAKFTSGHLW